MIESCRSLLFLHFVEMTYQVILIRVRFFIKRSRQTRTHEQNIAMSYRVHFGNIYQPKRNLFIFSIYFRAFFTLVSDICFLEILGIILQKIHQICSRPKFISDIVFILIDFVSEPVSPVDIIQQTEIRKYFVYVFGIITQRISFHMKNF